MKTIREALDAFLDGEKQRAPKGFEATELAVDALTDFLEGYGYQYVGEEAPTLSYLDEDLEPAFVETSTPQMLPVAMDEFLYYWQIRKFGGDPDDARANGETIERLMEWLGREGLADAKGASQAAALARTAADEVSRSKALEELLGPLTRMAPIGRPSDEDLFVEDFHRITRVEPGQLWLSDDVGPLAVATEASEIAEVGW